MPWLFTQQTITWTSQLQTQFSRSSFTLSRLEDMVTLLSCTQSTVLEVFLRLSQDFAQFMVELTCSTPRLTRFCTRMERLSESEVVRTPPRHHLLSATQVTLPKTKSNQAARLLEPFAFWTILFQEPMTLQVFKLFFPPSNWAKKLVSFWIWFTICYRYLHIHGQLQSLDLRQGNLRRNYICNCWDWKPRRGDIASNSALGRHPWDVCLSLYPLRPSGTRNQL